MPLAKTAKIWKFFRVITDDGVLKRQCLKCRSLLPVPKDGSTSHLINHLKSKGHEKQFQEYGLDTHCKVPPITSYFSEQQSRDNLQKNVDEELVRIMVRQNASIRFFDDPDEQARTAKAYPALKVHGRFHYSREVIPAMAEEIKKNIVQKIGDGYFAITSDGWQKPSKFPALLSVTTHAVNENFERLDNVLATIPIEKEHTGEEIAKLIEECLQKNGLPMNRLLAMVRDDASNMRKSCRLLEIESFQCSAHFYHLVVTDALKSDGIAALILKVRQWVGSTHRSSLSSLLLRYQLSEGLAEKRIPMDVPTRWNSTYLMLSGFFENKNALLKVEELLMDANTSRKPQDVSQTDWTKLKRLASSLQPLDKEDFIVVKELCKVLKAFHVETCRLSSEQSTASTYLPTVTRMMKHLQSMPIRNLVVSNVKTFWWRDFNVEAQ